MKIVFTLKELSNALNQEPDVLRELAQLADQPYKCVREEDGEFFTASCSFCDGILEVSCNRDWKIRSIFIMPARSNAVEVQLAEAPRSMSRSDARGIFGDPESSGEKQSHEILGELPAWDRFHILKEDCLLHLGYNVDCSAVDDLTIMPLDWQPGEN